MRWALECYLIWGAVAECLSGCVVVYVFYFLEFDGGDVVHADALWQFDAQAPDLVLVGAALVGLVRVTPERPDENSGGGLFAAPKKIFAGDGAFAADFTAQDYVKRHSTRLAWQ